MITPQLRPGVALVLAASLLAVACTGQDSVSRGRQTSEREPIGYDPEEALRATEQLVERGELYVALEVTYRSSGETVPGYLSIPTVGQTPMPCIVIQHGFNGSKEEARGVWEPFSLAGYGTLAIDARLHGQRGTEAERAAAVGSAAGMRSVLEGSVADLRRALDYLEQRRECDPDRLAFMGLSMGAFLGAVVAGSDQRVSATVLVVGGGDWRTFLEQTQLPELGWASRSPDTLDEAVEELDAVDPAHWVGRISPRPVLMINGDSDTVVPPDSARALHDAAREPAEVMWFEGGHLALGAELAETVATVFSWFEANLGSAPPD